MVTKKELPGPDTTMKEEAILFAGENSLYRELLEISSRLNWPEGYQNDLYVHDRDAVKINPGKDCIFIIRDMGTHLYHLADEGDEGNRFATDWCIKSIRYHSGEHRLNMYGPGDRPPRVFAVYASGESRELSAEKAVAFVRSRGCVERFIGP